MQEAKKSNLEIKYTALGDTAKVSFKGSITENAKIDGIDLTDKKLLNLDFNEITYISSAGVRRWILWMWNIEKDFPGLRIVIENCPKVMSKQIITVMRFIPKMTEIHSFYIPYFCESCQSSSQKLFETKPLLGLTDVEFNRRISQNNCLVCGSQLVVETSIEQFNKFINDYKSV